MAFPTRYIFSARMDVSPDKEALFNEVYDKEHVPMLSEVPGVVAIARFRAEPVTLMLGGERKTLVAEGEPRYQALYMVDSPDVLVSQAWANAVERGRWPADVRPHTSNRKHVMYHRIG